MEVDSKSKVKAQVKVESQMKSRTYNLLNIMKQLDLNLSLNLIFNGGIHVKTNPFRQERPGKDGGCE